MAAAEVDVGVATTVGINAWARMAIAARNEQIRCRRKRDDRWRLIHRRFPCTLRSMERKWRGRVMMKNHQGMMSSVRCCVRSCGIRVWRVSETSIVLLAFDFSALFSTRLGIVVATSYVMTYTCNTRRFLRLMELTRIVWGCRAVTITSTPSESYTSAAGGPEQGLSTGDPSHAPDHRSPPWLPQPSWC